MHRQAIFCGRIRFALLAAGAVAGFAAGAATPEEAAAHFDARRWPEAVEAYRAMVAESPANPGAWLRLASAQAADGDTEAAFQSLKDWAATGTLIYQAVHAAPELAALRTDPRFAALVEPLRPCAAPENRQFDFWLGEWDVTSPQYPGTTSRSRISRLNDGCTIREEYDTPVAYAGTSLNFYEARRRLWHQTWIDNQAAPSTWRADSPATPWCCR